MLFSKKGVSFLILALTAFLSQAQEKVLFRYPNGQPAIKGNCTFYLDAERLPSLASELFRRNSSLGMMPVEGQDTSQVPDADDIPYGFGKFNSGNRIPPYRGYLDVLKGLCLSCNGAVTSYYTNGQPSAVTSYEAGVPSGPYTIYYPNGKVLLRATLKQGSNVGTWEYYYKQGGRFAKGNFRPYPDSMMQSFWQEMLYPSEDDNRAFAQRWNYNPKTSFTTHGLLDGDRGGNKALDALFLHFDRLLFNSYLSAGIKDGTFEFYHRSGKKQAEARFSNDVRTGTWTYWNEGGQPLAKLYYSNKGELLKVADTSGKEYTVQAYTAFYEKEMDKREKENLAKQNAQADLYGIDPGIINKPAGDVNKPAGNIKSRPSDIFLSVEQMPEFNGNINTYLADNVRYPPEARKKKIEDRVVVKFIVDEQGRVKDPVIERSVSPELDAEALRVIKAMPRWKPGKQNGKPVSVYFRIPVKFVLE